MRKTLIALLTTGSLALTGFGTVTAVHAATTSTTTSTSRPAHHQGFGGRGFGMQGNDTELATLLGITTNELKAEVQSGKKLEDIATAHNITADQLKQFMDTQRQNRLTAVKAKLSQKVTDGKITQAQMDEMIQKVLSASTSKLDIPFIGRFIKDSHHVVKRKNSSTTNLSNTTNTSPSSAHQVQ